MDHSMQIDGLAAVPATDRIGHLISVSGSEAIIRLDGGSGRVAQASATVGRFAGIRTSRSLVVGMLTKISVESPSAEVPQNCTTGKLDLLGEIRESAAGQLHFLRGVTDYPVIGDEAVIVTGAQLQAIFSMGDMNTIDVGYLQCDTSIRACINVDEMLTKHFAIFGTTGVGKSSAVVAILHEVLKARPDFRIFLIDLHNEYGSCFGEQAQTLIPSNLKLPFWLFSFEEFVDVVFRARPGVEEELEILSELIPIAKSIFVNKRVAERPALKLKRTANNLGYSADTPVPYRMDDLVALLDDRIGSLEHRSEWAKYHRLKMRIATVCNDPRYAFMFENANVGGDTMVDVLSQLLRLPASGIPMTIMQLAGFPAEVVDSVVSVLCRMAFEFGLWSEGAFPLLWVCEEAHRYAPSDRGGGFGPTRKAISRIAKEGRKYGVFLGLITQRPAELDATIISQCSTLFTMRLSNDNDQSIVRAAAPDAATSLLSFVPSLGTREVFAFGAAVPVPTRLRFKELPESISPRSTALDRSRMASPYAADRAAIAAVVGRWRSATMSKQLNAYDVPRQSDETTEQLLNGRSKPDDDLDSTVTQKKSVAIRPDAYRFPIENTRQQNNGVDPIERFRR